MSGKTMTTRSYLVSSRLAFSACLLLVLISGSLLMADELGTQDIPLNCNSDIQISESVDAVDPALFHVALTIESTESNDVADSPVTQSFPTVTFFPSCSSTVPCVPAPGVDFVGGSGSSNCPQAFNMAAAGPNQVDFTFTPDLELGPNAGPTPADATSCNIFFDVRVNPAPAVATTFLIEATTNGVCNIPGFPPDTFTSSATGTDDVDFVPAVPTMGEIALAILAVLLLTGSMVMLRRRQQASQSAP